MSNWVEDTNGLIKLPSPSGSGYGLGGGKAEISLGGAMRGQAHGPSEISGLAVGLASIAGAADQWADVLAKQEERLQKADALRKTAEFQDKERRMWADLAEMKSRNGVENSVGFVNGWYKENGAELLKSAKSNFQKDFLENFFLHSRDAGLNRAFAHRARELDRYEQESWAGEVANTLALAESDPLNAGIYLGKAESVLKGLFDDREHPEQTTARRRDLREKALAATALSLARQGRFEDARSLLDAGEEIIGEVAGPSALASPLAGAPRVSSSFGPRQAPNTPQGQGSSNHQGVDYAVPAGTPIAAAGAGVVTFAGQAGGYGLQVKIKHGDGAETWYSHLGDLGGLKEGQTVAQGQIIAQSGNTGKSTGPHLDFKIKNAAGQFVDPEKVLAALAQPRPSFTGQLLDQVNEMEAKARRAEADQLADRQYEVMKDQVSGLELEAQAVKFLEFIKDLPDHDQRQRMLSRFNQDQALDRQRRQAQDQALTGKYLALAQSNGWSPSQTIAGVDKVEGLSEAGKIKLRKSLEDGVQGRPTAENRAALRDLRTAIDGETINSPEQIEAYAYEHNLTAIQAQAGLTYLEKGGQAALLKQSTINQALKNLKVGQEKWPADIFEQVAGQLEPGEFPSQERVRKIVANLLMSSGESVGSGWWWDRDETYSQALEKGRGAAWLPEVDSKEKEAIRLLMQSKGLESPTDKQIREFKKYELMGLAEGR